MTEHNPEDLLYTPEHEWLRIEGEVVTIGVTAYAQEALGDIVFVQLPGEGVAVEAGAPLGEIESTKSVSDVYAPVSGTVTARNDGLEQSPELVNSDPYGAGWLVRVAASGGIDRSAFLDASSYQAHVDTAS